MLVARKGMSALQKHRVISGEDSRWSPHTTWYMCHCRQAAMNGDIAACPGSGGVLKGAVEVGETYNLRWWQGQEPAPLDVLLECLEL